MKENLITVMIRSKPFPFLKTLAYGSLIELPSLLINWLLYLQAPYVICWIGKLAPFMGMRERWAFVQSAKNAWWRGCTQVGDFYVFYVSFHTCQVTQRVSTLVWRFLLLFWNPLVTIITYRTHTIGFGLGDAIFPMCLQIQTTKSEKGKAFQAASLLSKLLTSTISWSKVSLSLI